VDTTNNIDPYEPNAEEMKLLKKKRDLPRGKVKELHNFDTEDDL
jgi:hypothetical protein